jgi:hypothetical protein
MNPSRCNKRACLAANDSKCNKMRQSNDEKMLNDTQWCAKNKSKQYNYLATIGNGPILCFMLGPGIILCAMVLTPLWVILISRFCDQELLGIPLLTDAG